MKIVKLDKTDSTNTWIAQHEEELDKTSLVYCKEQTAGRGQRGNSWESEPGKNITASIVFHPENFPAEKQFLISEAIALAIVEFLREKGVEAKVKWPNDIYVGDKKICGILVEHVVVGRNITRTIAGFGININQKLFKSNAPNPVSLIMITGEQYDIDEEIEALASLLDSKITQIEYSEKIHDEFLNLLWRNDSRFYRFFDRKNNENILACIHSVGTDGVLTLKTNEGEKREYAFKEVEFTLDA